MKKLLFIAGAAVALCFIVFHAAFAETVGNPIDINIPSGKGIYSAEMSDFITINVGFDAETLIEQKFKYDSAFTLEAPELSGQYYMGRLSCTLFNRVQPYVKFGYSDLQMKWSDANGTVKVDGGSDFAWALGVKAYLWEFEGLGLKVFSTASYMATEPSKVRVSTRVGSGGITEKMFKVFQKQVTAGLSREFKIGSDYEKISLVPYAGIAWSDTTARVRVTQNGNVMNSGAGDQENNFGVFFGTEFLFMDNLSLNVEGRLIDQTAASVGFTALF